MGQPAAQAVEEPGGEQVARARGVDDPVDAGRGHVGALPVRGDDRRPRPAPGQGGDGNAVPLSADTGYFWFFDAANVELIVKVLDARVINGKFWVYYGALSDVEYTITVTDTVTGAQKTYFNPSGNLGSGADTSAF